MRAQAPPSLRRRAQPLSALRPLLERLHSAWRRAPPAKDCLPRVSDGGDADRARAIAEPLEEGELRSVEVLRLVHQHVPHLALHLRQQAVVALQKLRRQPEDGAEKDRAR